METVEAFRGRLIQSARDDTRVLGLWEDVSASVDVVVRAYVTVHEEGFASFYAERWSWLSSLTSFVLQQDAPGPYPVCLGLTRSGIGVWLALLPWGSVPEHPTPSPRVLLDKTGRLQERLHPWTSPERVDFRELDYWAERVWYELWRMAVLGERDVAGELHALAGALQAYLAFVSACYGDEAVNLAWQGKLATLAHVDEAVRHLAFRDLAVVIAHLMSEAGRALGEARGWTYPKALEEAVESFWRVRGWSTWRRQSASYL